MDYTKLSILELAKLLREGKVTSVELTKQVLAKIKATFGAPVSENSCDTTKILGALDSPKCLFISIITQLSYISEKHFRHFFGRNIKCRRKLAEQ